MTPTSGIRSGQVWAIVAWELRRAIAGRRWITPWLLSGFPVFLFLVRAFFRGPSFRNPALLEAVFSRIFEGYMLRLGIFFAAVAVFVQLFRRDVQDRSLHTWLLVPVRRELIVVGKYLAGLVHVCAFFVPATALCYLLLFAPGGLELLSDQFLNGGGLGRLAAYVAIVCGAVVGYGAVFLFVGTVVRNPILPVLLVLLLESFDGWLPGLLQNLSIIHALTALAPVPPGSAAAGTAALGSTLLGPFLLTVAALTLAARNMRRAQVNYGTD